MKKLLLLAIGFGMSFALTAQQNVVKLGLGAIFNSDVNLKYERAFAEKHSVQVAVLWDTPENKNLDLFLPDDVFNGVSIKNTGVAIVPEYRYYFSKSGSPRGFYIGAYGKFRTNNITTTSNFTTDYEVDAKLNIRSFGAGLGLGAQFIISDAFAIDWYIGGIGYNLYTTKLTASPTNPDEFDELKMEILDGIRDYEVPTDDSYAAAFLEAINIDELLDLAETGIENANVDEINTGRIPFSFLDVRFGLSLGYAF